MRWKTYQRTPKPCVYVIYLDTQMYYIGSTVNLDKRIEDHFRKLLLSVDPARVVVKYFNTADHCRLERELIQEHRPPANKAYIKPVVPPLDLSVCDLFQLGTPNTYKIKNSK